MVTTMSDDGGIQHWQEVGQQEMDDAYAEYVMEHCHGDRLICNGDTLINAMEDGYLYDDFMDSIGVKNEQ